MSPESPYGPAGTALWESIALNYALRPDETRVLADACHLADVIEALRAGMEGQQLLVKGSMGQPVLNPLLAEQKTHRTALAALLRQLKLPDEAGESGAGDPSTPARKAAAARWSRGA